MICSFHTGKSLWLSGAVTGSSGCTHTYIIETFMIYAAWVKHLITISNSDINYSCISYAILNIILKFITIYIHSLPLFSELSRDTISWLVCSFTCVTWMSTGWTAGTSPVVAEEANMNVVLTCKPDVVVSKQKPVRTTPKIILERNKSKIQSDRHSKCIDPTINFAEVLH